MSTYVARSLFIADESHYRNGPKIVKLYSVVLCLCCFTSTFHPVFLSLCVLARTLESCRAPFVFYHKKRVDNCIERRVLHLRPSMNVWTLRTPNLQQHVTWGLNLKLHVDANCHLITSGLRSHCFGLQMQSRPDECHPSKPKRCFKNKELRLQTACSPATLNS